MDKIEVLEFKRQNLKKGQPEGSKTLFFFNAEEYFLLILAFLLGRCDLFSTSFFSTSYLSSFKKKDYIYYLASLFSIFGIISALNRSSVLKYVVSILVITTVNHFFEFNVYIRAVIAAGSVFVGGVLSIGIFKGVPAEVLYLLLESLFCYCFVLLFERFFDTIESKKQFSSEQAAITIGVLALSFLGLSSTFDSVVDIKKILFFILLFTISFGHGMIMSTTMGFVVGLLDSIKEGSSIEMSCIFAFAALLAGVMKGFGKIGIALGGFCGYVISVFYISSNPTVKLREILIASALFCIFPLEKILINNNNEGEEIQKMIKEKIFGIASVLENFGDTSSQKVIPIISKDEAKNIIEQTCHKLCSGCQNLQTCWQYCYTQTNHNLNEIKNIILKKGKLDENDIKVFKFICFKSKEFVVVVNGFLESLKYSKLMRNEGVQKESTFKNQIELIKDIVVDAAKMVEKDLKQDRGTAKEIELELCRFGYEVEKVDFTVADDYFQVEIELKEGFKPPRKREIEEIVKEIVRCDIEIISEVPKQTGGYTISIIKKPNVRIDYAIFSKSKENVNGDRVCFLQLKDGKFLACISDGMGTGKAAAENSFIVIDALKKFTSLGFDRKIALKFINSLLAIKNTEGFASVDIVCIDRFSLSCEFLKAGAMPTYIKRANRVFEISSNSLPVGIETETQFEYINHKLEKGDMIFMCSDGLLELLGEDGQKELLGYLSSHEFLSTQSATKQIFEWAISNSYGIKDDVTIIVLKVGGASEKKGDEKAS
ncbi:phosphoprotein phosphatase [Caldicellulosiruptor changbaiensis]|uniref:Phosphoprotein phosphatase n=1 Tax=Caldicellulosiruptor changbaiensis TaxID=1222016 RepID=A0A3T0D277_9FIRM|nr:SpoIIE family protein phosphatase [Caldicellulosiruptor changbaiensis]AZT89298.1 phosphoprotein phosphatase [Caldicellulosiruptor changbaiensis]